MATSDYSHLVPATPDGRVLPLVVTTLRTDIAADTGWTLTGWTFTSGWERGPVLNWWEPFAIRSRGGDVILNGTVKRTGAPVPAGTIFGQLTAGLRPSRTEIITGICRIDPSGYVLSEIAAGTGEVIAIRDVRIPIG